MHFFEIWSAITGTVPQKHPHVLETILASLDEVENVDIKNLDSKILNLCKSLDRFWKIVSRSKSKFLNKYLDWLNEIECVELVKGNEKCIQKNANQPGPSCERGRPRKGFSDLSRRSKRRRLAELSQVDDSAVNALLNTSDTSNTSLRLNINADEVRIPYPFLLRLS